MAEGILSLGWRTLTSALQTIPDVVKQIRDSIVSVTEESPFSRKRRAPDTDTASASLSPSEEQQSESQTPTIQTDSRETFAATVAARQSTLPSGLRGEPQSKRPRHSPAWSSSPALHSAVFTPRHLTSSGVRTRAGAWRESLPPLAPRFSADSSIHFRPGGASNNLFRASPSPARAIRPSAVPTPVLSSHNPRVLTPHPRRPSAQGKPDTALARLIQGSHTASYMRRYRYRRDSLRAQRPVPDALRIDGGRIKKPDRARAARVAAAKEALVATDQENARALRESAWPPRFPKLPRAPNSIRYHANGSRAPNGMNGHSFSAAKRSLPAPVNSRVVSAFPTSSITGAPAPGSSVVGKMAPRLAFAPAAQVEPPMSAAQFAPSAARPPQRTPARPLPARHAVSEQQQSDVDSNMPLRPAEETLDLAKRAGISRDELCKIYTPGLVEMMEQNPLFAEKLLKKHGADMATQLLYPARRHERKWRITAAEEDLLKIRSQSRLYTSVQHHSEAVRTSALKATTNAFASAARAAAGQDRGAAEKPPSDDAPHWQLPYWLPNEDYWDEDDVSLAEINEGRTVVHEKSAFSPLTESAMKRLRKAMNDPNDHEQLNKIDGCIIHGADLRRLAPSVWLNDEIVNSYMQLIFQRSEKFAAENNHSNYAKVRVASSFFYSKMFAENKALGQMVYDYTRVRRWTRRFDVFVYDKFIIPINQHNMHWTLGVVDFKNKRVEHYDSFGGSGSGEILTNLMNWVRDEMEHKKGRQLNMDEWSQVAMTARLPQQNNSDDCGVFVCKYADFISRNAEMTFRAKHMGYFRARIAHELLMGRIA